MPRYFFDLEECNALTADDEGQHLVDLAAARSMAILNARSIMSAEVAIGRLCLRCSIRIRDEAGLVLIAVQFREALALCGV